MRNQINLVQKGLEPGKMCLTGSLLSKQTWTAMCVWSSVPGTLGSWVLCSPGQAVCRAGAGGVTHTHRLGSQAEAPRGRGRGGGLHTPGTCSVLSGTSVSHAGYGAECLRGLGGGVGSALSVSPSIFQRPFSCCRLHSAVGEPEAQGPGWELEQRTGGQRLPSCAGSVRQGALAAGQAAGGGQAPGQWL